MSEAVLDSSAVLALLFAESGADAVLAVLPGALISTVNLAEVLTKLIDRGMAPPMARAAIEATGIEVVPFDEDQAVGASELRTLSRALGLSLGDRACLALAKARDAVALTADHAWAKLPDLRVVVIR